MSDVYRALYGLQGLGAGLRELGSTLLELGLAGGAIVHFWARVLRRRNDPLGRRALDLLVACGVTAAGVLMFGAELDLPGLDGRETLPDLVDALEVRGLVRAARPQASRLLKQLTSVSREVSRA